MKNNSIMILVSIGCLIFAAGCSGINKIQIQEKLLKMSDRELINHYEMLEMRIADIDREREQYLKQERDMYKSQYPEIGYNHLGHLHIGDNWTKVRKEKELTLNEMRRRGLSPRRTN